MKLKELLAEKYNKNLSILHENILTDILMVVITTKLKRSLDAVKADPEYKELERQIKISNDEIQAIVRRLERNLDKREKTVNDMKKSGIDVNINMNSTQAYNAWRKWAKQTSNDKNVKYTKSELNRIYGK